MKTFSATLKKYIFFLKENRLYKKKNLIKYEIVIEKIKNWKKGNSFKKNLSWYQKIKNSCKAQVFFKKLEDLDEWKYDRKKGIIRHESGGFFSVEGRSVINAGREVNKWDQPFIKQNNLVGGIIGLVRCYINHIPHYLIEAKYEPGNFNQIQLSPSVQATYSNINQIHSGLRNKILNSYFKKKFKTIRKTWVSEDGGRLFKKRNLHWIISTQKKNIKLKQNYKWMTLYDINQFIEKGTYVGPHLRAILSLL